MNTNPSLILGRVRPFTDGTQYSGVGTESLHFPYDNSVVAEVESSTVADVGVAVASARRAFVGWRDTPAYVRSACLERIADAIVKNGEELARTIVLETGKTISDAMSEVARSVATMRCSSEEAKRLEGHTVPLDAVQAGSGKFGVAIRVPFGVVAGISPFNAPLNLTIHKLGPALAAGNSFVVKPHLHGSAVTVMLARLCTECGIPNGVFNVVTGGPEVGRALVTHPDVALVNFTGSTAIGEAIAGLAAPRKVLLELGGTGPTIVHSDANLDAALSQCADGAFGLSGQSCVSVQRLYVHRSKFDEAVERVVAVARARRTGNPLDPATTLAPLINAQSANRIRGWIDEAVAGGATLHCGGEIDGAILTASVLSGVTSDMKVVKEEIFGPVVVVIPFDDIDEAFAAANAGPYGLKVGIFTNDLRIVLRAMRELEFGTVNINGPSRSRTDHEPSGGTKRSGWAKEGPRYAIEEMTYLRMVSFAKMN